MEIRFDIIKFGIEWEMNYFKIDFWLTLITGHANRILIISGFPILTAIYINDWL